MKKIDLTKAMNILTKKEAIALGIVGLECVGITVILRKARKANNERMMDQFGTTDVNEAIKLLREDNDIYGFEEMAKMFGLRKAQ